MMKLVLIDDEYYALKGLEMELSTIDNVEIIGMYDDENRALEDMERLKPDVVFLDIDMPSISGIEMFSLILEKSPHTKIVFVTAYDSYAVKAFELNASDYIVKPVRNDRLIKSIERLMTDKSKNIREEEKNISINCFGPLSIKVNGSNININWRTKKVEELIAFLSCYKGEFVSKEKIAGTLWPDMDTEKSKSNLYLAYYYLKKQSEENGFTFPIESKKGKMRLKLEEVKLDLIEFENIVRHKNILTSDEIDTAVEIYKGSLLDGHYYEWNKNLEYYYSNLYDQVVGK